jgi:hypothetical protein
VRSWCAQEALKWQASCGLWAGIWIDGRHQNAVPYLEVIASGDAMPAGSLPPADDEGTDYDVPICTPLVRPSSAVPSRSTATTVLARSSGSCEVFTEGCRYTFDRLVARCPDQDSTENPSPAHVFAACTVCADTLARLESRLAKRFGYTVDAGRDPASVLFHWRGSRWVLFDRDGWLTEMRENAQTA